MKKSTLLALLVFLSAIAGALATVFVYLNRREAELDEYEQLLFSEDFSYGQPDADEAECAAPATLEKTAATAVKAAPKSAAKKAAPKKAAAK